MSTESLVFRSGYLFQFDERNPDVYFTEFASLVSPSQVKAARLLLAVHGAYDNCANFVNDLRIHVDHFDEAQGERLSTDISDAVVRHYTAQLLDIFPDEAQFAGSSPISTKFENLVAFFEPSVAAVDRKNRVQEVLSALHRRLSSGSANQLGTGNAMSRLAELHWFSGELLL